MKTIRTYSELISIPTYVERFQYLKLKGRVGDSTFADKRYLNQMIYTTDRWRSLRNRIIIRDDGCDLGILGREIYDRITVHHIDPITIDDIINNNDKVFDPDNLITSADITHKAIHYGDEHLLMKEPVIRREYDTCPWRH